MRHVIRIQSFHGIGDLLFLTPSLSTIKRAYPDLRIHVNTQFPELLERNPHVDRIGSHRIGTLLAYPDPALGIHPLHHNILTDWHILCAEYGLITEQPELLPDLYLPLPQRSDVIRVQVIHNGHFHRKRVWPYFDKFARRYEHATIEKQETLQDLVRVVAESRLVVCADSGIQHIARAVGTPAVVVYGGFSKPKWNGYAEHCNIVNYKNCSPCYSNRPCVNRVERACMREIPMEHVQSMVEAMLVETEKTSEQRVTPHESISVHPLLQSS